MFSLKDLSSIFINDISKFINQVTFRIDPSAKVIDKLAILVSLWKDITVAILINLTNAINDIKSTTIEVKQLG
jgi:hypothetical protein